MIWQTLRFNAFQKSINMGHYRSSCCKQIAAVIDTTDKVLRSHSVNVCFSYLKSSNQWLCRRDEGAQSAEIASTQSVLNKCMLRS